MEFGIFLNGYIPGPAAHDTFLEHELFRREAEYTELADKHNWKYAWFGEHHSLTEYSHLSASEVMIGYCAHATERIHLGSAIVSLPPVKDHPVRVAERAAMLDHLTNQRYEFGTGPRRGQPRGRDVRDHGHERDQGDVGRGHPRDPADVGPARLRVRPATHFTVPTRTTSCRSRTARGTRRCGWRAATRPRSPRRARSASARSRSTSSRSTT